MKNQRPLDRRAFLRNASAAGVGAWAAGRTSPLFAYRGAPNEKVVVAVMGVNGRGSVLASGFARNPNSEVAYVVDVDRNVLSKEIESVGKLQPGRTPRGAEDLRRVLDDPDIDALVIAAPDHWHTPATLMALEAGKHVYVEKPLGHNPAEGEMLVAAQRKYPNLRVQMGNQQRSDPRSIEIVQAIHGGLIGRAYYAQTWYANARGPIGRGKVVPVPAYLNWELWQGPAPRTPYRDNLVHYNWHWFWRWGTGEIVNNGTHEIDVARWALDVDYPVRVTSAGGRHHYNDDWEFYDTQDTSFDFTEGKTISWTGRSSNGFPLHNRGRGTTIHGTNGTVLLDRDGYILYDMKNKVVRENVGEEKIDSLNTRGGDPMTDRHIANFLDGVRTGSKLNSPVDEAHKSVLLCHLGNIAQQTGTPLWTDAKNGRVLNSSKAEKMWSRDYAPGWKPKV